MSARQATPDDTDELVRLRAVLFDGHVEGANDDSWRETARKTMRRRLGGPEPTAGAFVVDDPDGPGLVACAVGLIEQRFGNPLNPSGMSGYVLNVATDPAYRRRGYSKACMEALLGWYRSRGITAIMLHASPDGEPLYAGLGFVRNADPSMRLSL